MDKLILLKGDAVRYTGSKTFKTDSGEPLNIRGKVGVIEANVQNSEELIVDFGGHAFVCSPKSLDRASYSGDDDHYMKHVERKWRTSDERGGKKKSGKDSGGSQ